VCIYHVYDAQYGGGVVKKYGLEKKNNNNNRNLTVRQHRRRYTGYEGRSRRGPERVCGDGILELLCIHRIIYYNRSPPVEGIIYIYAVRLTRDLNFFAPDGNK